MIRTKLARCALLLGAGCLVLASAGAAALEHGHVRARTRAFVHNPNPGSAGGSGSGSQAANPDLQREAADAQVNQPTVEAEGADLEGVDADRPAVARLEPVRANAAPMASGPGLGERLRAVARRGAASGAGLVLIGTGRGEADRRVGYLAEGGPRPLRFSDRDPVHRRPISPALPEFTFMSDEFEPYLIESALPEDAGNDPEMLAELVIELEPHEVVSGRVDTRRRHQEERVESFALEEPRTSVLRPEEVLIFFEAQSPHGGRSGGFVPFAPATPAATHKSSAKLIKE